METSGNITLGPVSTANLAIIPALPTNLDTGIRIPGNDDVLSYSIDLEASTADLQVSRRGGVACSLEIQLSHITTGCGVPGTPRGRAP
jgi:hypothetical protein